MFQPSLHSDPVLVFPCQHQHVICISCFSMYCENKVNERRFVRVEQPKNIGYTLSCPGGDGEWFEFAFSSFGEIFV